MVDKNPSGDNRRLVVGTKVPETLVEVIDGLARARLMDRSEWFREAILDKLRSVGVDVAEVLA